MKDKQSHKKNKSELKTIILTAIITAFLTVITQYFLQKSQLSNEQDYWKERYNIENVQNINTVRLKLIEEISDGILQLEILAKEIKIQNVVVKYLPNKEELEELKLLTIKYHKDLYRITSKMEIASIYFDNDVDKKLLKLSTALTENYQNNYVKSSLSNIKIPELDLDFETIEKLPKIKKQTFEAMLKNMNKDFEQNYKK